MRLVNDTLLQVKKGESYMNSKDRYKAIEILDYVDMYCNLDSIDSDSREDIIKYIISKFNKEDRGEQND